MGYIDDYYVGYSFASSCPYPTGSFDDGRDRCEWTHRFAYDTDPVQVTADQTNFLLYISEACFSAAALSEIMANVQNGGADIRLTLSDGETEIPFYVQTCDTGTNTLRLWARLTGTLSSSVSDRVFIYTGNAAASAYAVTATYGRNNCFQSFEYFLLMNADPSGGTLVDATGKTASWTIDNMEAGDQVTQVNGMEAYTFDGTNERLYKDTSYTDAGGAVTALVKINSVFGANGQKNLWGYGGDANTANPGLMIIRKRRNNGNYGDTNTRFDWIFRVEGSAQFHAFGATNPVSNGSTYLFSIVCTATVMKMYQNGAEETLINYIGDTNARWFDEVNVDTVGNPRVAVGDLFHDGAWNGAASDDTIGPVFQESVVPVADTQSTRNNCYVTPGTFGTVTSWIQA